MNFCRISHLEIWWSNQIERTILQRLYILEQICFPDEYRSNPEQFKKILLFVIEEIEVASRKNYLLGLDFIASEISNVPKEIAENIRNYAKTKIEEIEPIESDDIGVLCEIIKSKLKYITDHSYDADWPYDYEPWDKNLFFDLFCKLDTFIQEL